jgi:hypothetical protein
MPSIVAVWVTVMVAGLGLVLTGVLHRSGERCGVLPHPRKGRRLRRTGQFGCGAGRGGRRGGARFASAGRPGRAGGMSGSVRSCEFGRPEWQVFGGPVEGGPGAVRGGLPRRVVSCRRSGPWSCAQALGGDTPLQVSPNGKPGGPDRSVRRDLVVRVLDGGVCESDESACLDRGRILDVFGIAPGHCPRCEVGQRVDVESDIVRCWK